MSIGSGGGRNGFASPTDGTVTPTASNYSSSNYGYSRGGAPPMHAGAREKWQRLMIMHFTARLFAFMKRLIGNDLRSKYSATNRKWTEILRV